MRLSELVGRELVNLKTGEKIGQFGRADLYINDQTGKIESVILPVNNSVFSFKKDQEQVVPWNSVEKVGADMILINFSSSREFDRN